MKENIESFPYRFDSKKCKACNGRCCRGFGGYVWISMEELEKMACHRKMDIALFSRQYVRKIQDKLSLIEFVINGEHF